MSRDTGNLKMQQKSKAALISIHPKYVDKILDGSKKVEFRRVWAAQEVTHLVVYSTSPEMKVMAIVEIEYVRTECKYILWEIAKNYGGGLTRKELRKYFYGVKKGNALLLGNVNKLKKPLPLPEIIPGVRAPQSYLYLNDEQFSIVQSMDISGD